MIKAGDVVFFKAAKRSSKRKDLELRFKGYGFGVFLGHVPPFALDPPEDELMRRMGTCGFVSFDDIGEFFGDEVGAQCVKKFEDKYYTVKKPDVQAELPVAPVDTEGPIEGHPPSSILGPNGKPIQ